MLKALADFGVTVTDGLGVQHFLAFRVGDIIRDPQIARAVLSLQCPVTMVSNYIDVTCPRCRTIPPTSHLERESLTFGRFSR